MQKNIYRDIDIFESIVVDGRWAPQPKKKNEALIL